MSSPTAPELSVLVVSYNTRELLLECLTALRETTTGLSLETLVFDNASTDGSAEAVEAGHPEVRLLRSETNLGFAVANNRAAEQAQGRYLLLLNPDTLVLEGAVENVLAFAKENPTLGAVGGRTLFADRSLNPASCWAGPTAWSLFCHGIGLTVLFRRSALFDPESLGSWPRDTARKVDIVSGCFLLMESNLWRELDGFDESFFMYGEDADLCLRAGSKGRPCMITPNAGLVHYGGASEKVRVDKMVRLFEAKSRLFAKHWSPLKARYGSLMLDLWAFTRMLAFGALGLLHGGARERGRTWRSIWKRRGEWTTARFSSAGSSRPGS